MKLERKHLLSRLKNFYRHSSIHSQSQVRPKRVAMGIVTLSMVITSFPEHATAQFNPADNTSAAIGVPRCNQNSPGIHKGTLLFHITNGNGGARFFNLRVSPHGHNNLLVPGRSSRSFRLEGIPDGHHFAEVTAGIGQTLPKSRIFVDPEVDVNCSGLVTEVRWNRPGSCDGSAKRPLSAWIISPQPFEGYSIHIRTESLFGPNGGGQVVHVSHIQGHNSRAPLLVNLGGIPVGRRLYAQLFSDALGPLSERAFDFFPCRV